MTILLPSQTLLRFSVEVQNLLRDFNPATVNYTIQVRETLGTLVHRGTCHRLQGRLTAFYPSEQYFWFGAHGSDMCSHVCGYYTRVIMAVTGAVKIGIKQSMMAHSAWGLKKDLKFLS
jgi:hypothetical protein